MQDEDAGLKKIRSRARALILFTYRMQNEALSGEQRDREMTIARSNTRVLRAAVRDFLIASQPQWYGMNREERIAATQQAFEQQRLETQKERYERRNAARAEATESGRTGERIPGAPRGGEE